VPSPHRGRLPRTHVREVRRPDHLRQLPRGPSLPSPRHPTKLLHRSQPDCQRG
jgi:hypothetical protein